MTGMRWAYRASIGGAGLLLLPHTVCHAFLIIPISTPLSLYPLSLYFSSALFHSGFASTRWQIASAAPIVCTLIWPTKETVLGRRKEGEEGEAGEEKEEEEEEEEEGRNDEDSGEGEEGAHPGGKTITFLKV
jgi:hypothetical protein